MANKEEKMPKEDARVLLLYLLKQFEKVCKHAGIYYYASGGTCLGAIRHQGFIPWDDDIDVMMPREFYNKFVSSANAVLEPPVVIRTRENDPYFCQEYIKLCFKDDVFGWSDLSIDVFFLDETNPARQLFRAIQNKILLRLYAIKLYKVSKDGKGEQYVPHNPIKRAVLGIAGKVLSYDAIDRIHKKTMTAEKSAGDFYVNWGSCYSYKKATYGKSILGKPHRASFENTTISLAEHPKAILNQLYGADYMTPPPPEKRTDHGVRAISCKALDMEKIKNEVGDIK